MTDPTEYEEWSPTHRGDEPMDTGAAAEPAPHHFPVDSDDLLVVDNVTLRFGGVVALDGVDFALRRGEIFGLIGPNGAGKTTCFNAMTGVYRPTSGEIRFQAR